MFELQKDTENVDPKMLKTKNGRLMLSSKYAVWSSKKLRFIKEQEPKGSLSKLGIKMSLSNIPLLGKTLFNFIVWTYWM